MKKTVFLLLLAAMFAPWAMMAQEPTTQQLTVYNSEASTESAVPINVYRLGGSNYYAKSQTIFPAEDIEAMTGGTITQIKFYTNRGTYNGNDDVTTDEEHPVYIYMTEVSEHTINSYVNRSSCSVVYTGTLTYHPTDTYKGEVVITLSTPYEYNGGNLLFGSDIDLGMNSILAGYNGVYAEGAAAGSHSSYSSVYFSTVNHLPKTQFTFIPPSCSRPTGLSVSAMTPTTATLSWTENGEATAWDICLNEDEDNLITVNANPYTLTGLNPGAPYTIKVRANCGTQDQSAWSRAVSFMPADRVTVGSGEETSPALPTDFFRRHNISQQIYTVSELGSAGAIMGIDLFKEEDSYSNNLGRYLKIYMVNTDLNTFESDWISVTEDDLVFEDVAVFANNEWTTIEFSRPFNYDGSHNVAVVVCDNTAPRGGGDGWIRFRSFKASETDFPTIVANNNIMYEHGSTYSINATNITVAADSISHWKNQMRFLKIACIPPTGIAVSDVTTSSATLSWTERGAANSWVLEYSTSSDFSSAQSVDVNTDPVAILTGLSVSTPYYVRVRANCGSDGGVYWSVPFSFTTDCNTTDKCEIFYELTTATWSSGTWYGNGLRVLDVESGAVLATLTIGDEIYDYDTGEEFSPDTPEETDGLTYARGSIFVCSGHSIRFEWIPNSNRSACFYSFYDADFLPFGWFGEGDQVYYEESDPDQLEDVVYYVSCNPNPCPRPTHVAVNYEGGTTATVTWDNVGSDYDVGLINHENGEFIHIYSTTTNSYTLTNLDLATTYDVQVVTVCDRDNYTISHASRTATFTTDLCMPEDQCSISYELHDSYGDGWNGAAIKVMAVNTTDWSETVIATWTIGSDEWGEKSGDTEETDGYSYTRGTLGVCDGSEIMFRWQGGGCDEECSFTIYDPSGAVIFSGTGMDIGEIGGDEWLEKSDEENLPFITSLDVNCSGRSIGANSWCAISAYTQGGYYLGDYDGLTSGADYDLYRYNEATASWENYKNTNHSDFTSLVTGRGYIYRSAYYTTLDFGTANEGDVASAYALTNTGSCPDANLQGFNLIGNPYQHAIYKGVNFPATNLTTGFYSLECDGSWRVHTDSDPIAIGEGVLVKFNGSSQVYLSFTEGGAKMGGNDDLNKGASKMGLQFSVVGCGHEDVAYAMLNSQHSEGLPKVAHLNAEAPSLSIPQGGKDYAIAMIDGCTQAFPLKFRAVGNGEYTVSVSGDLNELGYLHLIDRATGRDIDLLSQPTYTFTNTRSQASTQRFTVKLSPNADEEDNGIFAYQNGDRIVVEGTGTLQVYDVLGRQLYTHEINSQLSISNSQFPGTGVYILRLGEKSQKLVIK